MLSLQRLNSYLNIRIKNIIKMKETILIIVVISSLILGYFSIKNIHKANQSPNVKFWLTYLTIICPILGFFASLNLRSQK